MHGPRACPIYSGVISTLKFSRYAWISSTASTCLYNRPHNTVCTYHQTSRPIPLTMTSLRAFRPQDLLRMNLTNLDPLTENYSLDFYLHYLMTWPSLFTVAEDQDGNVIGYSWCSREASRNVKVHSLFRGPTSDGQSRRRPFTPTIHGALPPMARPCHRSKRCPAV